MTIDGNRSVIELAFLYTPVYTRAGTIALFRAYSIRKSRNGPVFSVYDGNCERVPSWICP